MLFLSQPEKFNQFHEPERPRHGLAVGTTTFHPDHPSTPAIPSSSYTILSQSLSAKTRSGPQSGSSTAKASSRASLPVEMNSRLTKFPGPNAGQTRRYRPLARVAHSENATFICGSAEETRWQPEGNYPRLTAYAVCWLIPGGIDEALVEHNEMNDNTPVDAGRETGEASRVFLGTGITATCFEGVGEGGTLDRPGRRANRIVWQAIDRWDDRNRARG